MTNLHRIARWPRLESAMLASGTGLLYGKTVPTDPADWVELAHVCMDTQPGGKHVWACTSDEGWGYALGAACRIALEHGNVGTGNRTAHALVNRLYQWSQWLWLKGEFSGVVWSVDPHPAVAYTYPWCYKAPACTTDDSALLSLVDGWAWMREFAIKTGYKATADWCRDRIVEAATTMRRLYARHGGIPQFYDSRTGQMVWGRHHEPAACEVRATIHGAWVCLYAWAVAGDEECLSRARMMRNYMGDVLASAPYTVWFDGGDPVGAGFADDPDTMFSIMDDEGPECDMQLQDDPKTAIGQIGQVRARRQFAVIPAPTPGNPNRPSSRNPVGNRNELEALKAAIDAEEQETT